MFPFDMTHTAQKTKQTLGGGGSTDAQENEATDSTWWSLKSPFNFQNNESRLKIKNEAYEMTLLSVCPSVWLYSS
jgi:hypothetical protein